MIPFSTFHKSWCKNQTQQFIDSPFSQWFNDDPRYSVQDYSMYIQTIKYPVWLKLIQDRIKHDIYRYVHEWVRDMETIWENAILFNPPDTEPYELALFFQRLFRHYSLPVPSSQEEFVQVVAQRKLNNLIKIMNNIPPKIKELNWNIPIIKNVGESTEKLQISSKKLPPEIISKLHKIFAETTKDNESQNQE